MRKKTKPLTRTLSGAVKGRPRRSLDAVKHFNFRLEVKLIDIFKDLAAKAKKSNVDYLRILINKASTKSKDLKRQNKKRNGK